VQSRLLSQIIESLFRLKLKIYYERSGGFLELDMEHILNESFKVFEDYSSKMSKSTSREAWTGDDAIAKIREDYSKIEERF